MLSFEIFEHFGSVKGLKYKHAARSTVDLKAIELLVLYFGSALATRFHKHHLELQ